jgi:poly-gamma-glutamate capsule biosynthesis protein CapA/YwtB (metallophosphatase superfamily)
MDGHCQSAKSLVLARRRLSKILVSPRLHHDKRPVVLLIGADLSPIGLNGPLLRDGDPGRLFNDLVAEFQAADLCLANLECPLIERSSPLPKTGPNFGESPDCLRGIQRAGIDVLCLANNHVLDHGAAGLQNTLQACARAGIETVGAGGNLAEARRMLIREVRGFRIGILAMAEHEFSIATPDSPGANPLDVMDFVRHVTAQRGQFDYLVVLLHGGHEFHVPSPRLQDTCRFLIEAGAQAVIVQHPHCLGGIEAYRGGHIVYGQGALLMDEAIYRDLETFHEGFLVKLTIPGDGRATLEMLPFVQSHPAPGVRKMNAARAVEFRQRLEVRSQAILDGRYVQAQWWKFCEARKHAYLSALLGHPRVVAKLNAKGLLTRHFYGQGSRLRIRNLICCETHREALETILQQWIA